MNPELHKTKLIRLLKSLNSKELKRFQAYVVSPFFNKNQRIIGLLNLLQKDYPDFSVITKPFLFQQLFPEKVKYDDVALRTVFSGLTKLLKDYLTYIDYEQDAYAKDYHLLYGLSERNVTDVFDRTLNSVINHQKKKKLEDTDYLYHQYILSEISYVQTSMSNNRALKSSLQDTIHALDMYYIANKLRYAWAALNRQNIVEAAYDLGYFFREILTILEQTKDKKIPIIDIYYNLVSLLLDKTKEVFYFKVKELLQTYPMLIKRVEIRDMYVILIGYCRWQSRQGNEKYIKEALDLYKSMLSNNILYIGGYLSPHHFKNIISLALQFQEFDWTNNFIHQYQKQLNPIYEKNITNYNKALLFFAQEDYNHSADFLREIQFSDEAFVDDFHYVSYKILLIKTYYEVNELDALLSALESFRIYLHRNKAIAKEQIKGYNNFIKLAKRLINLKMGKKRVRKNLKQAIEETKPIELLKWLLDKVEELEAK